MNIVRSFVWLFCVALLSIPAAQAQLNSGSNTSYVVVGAFSIHNNAIRFTSHVHNELNMPAQFELNTERQLYYVYVMSTPDRTEAVRLAMKLRRESELAGTWVYSGYFGTNDNPSRGVDINPVNQKKITSIASNDQKVSSEIVPVNTVTTTPADSVRQEIKPEKESAADNTDNAGGKPFTFKLYRGADGKVVEGDVDVIDTDKAKKVGSYKGNITVNVPPPAGKSGTLSLTSYVFGYRKLQREINYAVPDGEDIEKDEEGNVVVPFELVRLRKGDIVVMYNVFFFKDAAIMRPESRYEVNGLQQMLEENPKCKIRIHGHTNGGASGKIIEKNKDNDNYFSLNDSKDGYGSAKRLSEARAELIKDYLVSTGIAPERLEVKAWGGKRPIHDKHHTRAHENVRVEIEILEE